MSTNNCNHDQPCGCNNDELTTLPDPCDTTNCTGEACEQIINCDCVRYDGAPIPQIGVEAGDTLCDILSGLVGLGGVPGPQGVQGPQGLKGDDGDDGPQGEQGERGLRGLSGLQGFFPEIDSGWQRLDGFTFQDDFTVAASGSYNEYVPWVRRIGKTLHFRGIVWVPLAESNDSNVYFPPENKNTNNIGYIENKSSKTWTGSGEGCNIITDGAIQFKKNTSVIPTTVVPSGTLLDGNYSMKILARRRISTYNSTLLTPYEDEGSAATLNSYFNVVITKNKTLAVGLEEDVESVPAYTGQGTAPTYINSMRLINSKIEEGQRVILYNNDTSELIHSSNDSAGDYPLIGNSSPTRYYGFSCDASKPDQIGGFYFPLDGLTAYLAPAVLASGFSTLSAGAKTNVSIAIIGGSISNLGGGTPYYKGICYFEGSVGNPTINDYYVLSTDPTPQVIGNITITGLLPATDYRFRSFVVTEAGTTYGTTITATTN